MSRPEGRLLRTLHTIYPSLHLRYWKHTKAGQLRKIPAQARRQVIFTSAAPLVLHWLVRPHVTFFYSQTTSYKDEVIGQASYLCNGRGDVILYHQCYAHTPTWGKFWWLNAGCVDTWVNFGWISSNWHRSSFWVNVRYMFMERKVILIAATIQCKLVDVLLIFTSLTLVLIIYFCLGHLWPADGAGWRRAVRSPAPSVHVSLGWMTR